MNLAREPQRRFEQARDERFGGQCRYGGGATDEGASEDVGYVVFAREYPSERDCPGENECGDAAAAERTDECSCDRKRKRGVVAWERRIARRCEK